MSMLQQKNELADHEDQNLLFEEIICSPEFPQVCIDPQDDERR